MPSHAPVAVFGYARVAQLRRTLEQLAAGPSFGEHRVHLFLDGAKGNGDEERVAAVRKMAEGLHWPNLRLRRSPENRGLKRSIIDGVSELIAEHGRVIVIEDDLLCSPMALEYFNAGLDAYSKHDRVKAVCGYMYKLRAPAPAHRAFFLPFASSWGWATWRRAWEPFVPAQERLLARAGERSFQAKFDRQGIIAASTMLRAQEQGLIDSWAILWNAYLAETDGLALFPAETMVLNGGFADATATHSSRNPLNRMLVRMNAGRELASAFGLPDRVETNEVMRQRIANSWESRLHRLSSRLGYYRRRTKMMRMSAAARRAKATEMTDRKIRLAMLSPWVTRHGGGVAEAVRLLASQVSQRGGFDVEVMSVKEKDGTTQLEGWGSARISTFRYFGPGNYRFSPGLLWHLLRSDADIVHVHGIWTFQCVVALIWSVLRGRRYVVSPHGMLEEWILARSRVLKALVSGLYQDAFLRRAWAIHVLTDKEGHDVHRFAGPPKRWLIPNFVEIPPDDVKRPVWWKPEYAERTVFLYLGRIHVKKGWQELCTAWEQLCASTPTFAARGQLVFCGWIDDSPDFESRLAELTARFGNAVFAGPQYGDERLASLAAADAFVLPSRSEGLPMVVLEAWASRVPALMTRECNLPIGFEAGAAIELGLTAGQVAEGLEQFATLSADERQRMGRKGLALVEREFSAAAAEARFVQLYRDAVASMTGATAEGKAKESS